MLVVVGHSTSVAEDSQSDLKVLNGILVGLVTRYENSFTESSS